MNTTVKTQVQEKVSQNYNTHSNLEIHKKALFAKIKNWKFKVIDEVIRMMEIIPKWIGQEIVKIKKDAYYGDQDKIFVIIKDNDILVKGIYQGIKNTTVTKTFEDTKATYNLAEYSLYGMKKIFDKIYNPVNISLELEDFSNELKTEFMILMQEAESFNIKF
jgi:hypothetical protein